MRAYLSPQRRTIVIAEPEPDEADDEDEDAEADGNSAVDSGAGLRADA